MVIEYIKRNQKMGYEGDKLVYKVPLTQEAPAVVEEVPVVEEAPAAVEAPVEEETVVLPE
jgi:hypothetical protein